MSCQAHPGTTHAYQSIYTHDLAYDDSRMHPVQLQSVGLDIIVLPRLWNTDILTSTHLLAAVHRDD